MQKGKNFKELLASVEAVVFDVDGVLTDGSIIPYKEGDFLRMYNAKDGYAIAYAVHHGFNIGIISGGFGPLLEYRTRKLGVKHAYLNCMDKIAALHDFAEKTGVNLENVVYMGDDIPDLECMREVGIPVCPADACSEVINQSLYISEKNGGKGAARDIIEQILRAKGIWALSSMGVMAQDSKDVASR